MLDQDDHFCLISLSILTTCLLDVVSIFWGEVMVTCLSLLGAKELNWTRYSNGRQLDYFPYCHFG